MIGTQQLMTTSTMDHPLLYWDYQTCEADCWLRLLVAFWKQRLERVSYFYSLSERLPPPHPML